MAPIIMLALRTVANNRFLPDITGRAANSMPYLVEFGSLLDNDIVPFI